MLGLVAVAAALIRLAVVQLLVAAQEVSERLMVLPVV